MPSNRNQSGNRGSQGEASEAAQKMRSQDPRERSEGAQELGHFSHKNDSKK